MKNCGVASPIEAERDERLVEQMPWAQRGDGAERDRCEKGDRHPGGDELERLGQEAHDDVEGRFVAEVGGVAEVEMYRIGDERPELRQDRVVEAEVGAQRGALLLATPTAGG